MASEIDKIKLSGQRNLFYTKNGGKAMLNSNRGQQISEFTLVFIFIAIGIIVMGPYVIRSWNGQMKSWDDSVHDSLTDQLNSHP
ncbi:MAG: hypothetical protein HQL23_09575 [Candidatus Omnitrophica bacterium]|nr:hypothetical protein [Candidatus Omnitrophota bacterium]